MRSPFQIFLAVELLLTIVIVRAEIVESKHYHWLPEMVLPWRQPNIAGDTTEPLEDQIKKDTPFWGSFTTKSKNDVQPTETSNGLPGTIFSEQLLPVNEESTVEDVVAPQEDPAQSKDVGSNLQGEAENAMPEVEVEHTAKVHVIEQWKPAQATGMGENLQGETENTKPKLEETRVSAPKRNKAIGPFSEDSYPVTGSTVKVYVDLGEMESSEESYPANGSTVKVYVDLGEMESAEMKREAVPKHDKEIGYFSEQSYSVNESTAKVNVDLGEIESAETKREVVPTAEESAHLKQLSPVESTVKLFIEDPAEVTDIGGNLQGEVENAKPKLEVVPTIEHGKLKDLSLWETFGQKTQAHMDVLNGDQEIGDFSAQSFRADDSPTLNLTSTPTSKTSSSQTSSLTGNPTAGSTNNPTSVPTSIPTSQTTVNPTAGPTRTPTYPTSSSTSRTTSQPASSVVYVDWRHNPNPRLPDFGSDFDSDQQQSNSNAAGLASIPTDQPTSPPTLSPTDQLTSNPIAGLTSNPTSNPTASPIDQPTSYGKIGGIKSDPFADPTPQFVEPKLIFEEMGPSGSQTTIPTTTKTMSSTSPPTLVPTDFPTNNPTTLPMLPITDPETTKTMSSTSPPTLVPTDFPTKNPTTLPMLPITDPETTGCTLKADIECAVNSANGDTTSDCSSLNAPEALKCVGETPSQLRFMYTGLNCSESGREESMFTCSDQNGGPRRAAPSVFIRITDTEEKIEYFNDITKLGQLLEVDASLFDENLSNILHVTISSVDMKTAKVGTTLQTMRIPTACTGNDSSISLLENYGALQITSFKNFDQGFQSAFVTIEQKFIVRNTGGIAATVQYANVTSNLYGDATLLSRPVDLPSGESQVFRFLTPINLYSATGLTFSSGLDVSGVGINDTACSDSFEYKLSIGDTNN